MIRLRITTKIYLLAALSSLAALVGIIYLSLRTESLIELHERNIALYTHQGHVAREMEINFKKQVQEWKNILLRGNDPNDLTTYSDLFNKQENLVRANANKLVTIIDDTILRMKVIEFEKAHEELGKKYRNALSVFIQDGGADPRRVDLLVRGLDRSLTTQIEELAILIEQAVSRYKESQQLARANEQRITTLTAAVIFIGLFVVSAVLGFHISKPIQQLAKIVRSISAQPNYSIRAEALSRDEIGELAAGFNEMMCQIQKNEETLQREHDELEMRVRERTKDLNKSNELLQAEIAERTQISKEREQVIHDLKNALDNIKTLSGLLPICANCKKIRDDKGYWNQVEGYITTHTDVKFSHGLCPECKTKYLEDLVKEDS